MPSTAPLAAPAVATDFSGYEPLRAKARENDPAALHAAVKQFESLFTQMLMKSMRDATPSDGSDPMTGGEQGDFYRDMFDQQLSLSLSNPRNGGRGLGIAEMMERQLTPHARIVPANATLHRAGTQEDSFLTQILPHASRAAAALGVDPAAIVAQSALETGWGRKTPGGNLFGIKAHGSEPAAQVQTLEYKNGVAHTEQAAFRAYTSTAESVADYAKLVGNAERYAGARNTGKDIAAFAKGLQDGGYATDPAYADKIKAIVNAPGFRERLDHIARKLGVEL